MKLLNKNDVYSLLTTLFSFLFLYSSSYKISDYNDFGISLYNSHLIPEVSIFFLQIALPLIEIMIFILLNLKKTRYFSLKVSFFILTLYTVYLITINNFSLFDGCSCGGIFVDLDYVEHVILNFCFVFFNAFLLFYKKKTLAISKNKK